MSKHSKDKIQDKKNLEKKNFAKKIGAEVRKAREARNLSQEELANNAGYYRTYVGHIETGTYSPSVHTVWRLAKAMDMKLSELLKNL